MNKYYILSRQTPGRFMDSGSVPFLKDVLWKYGERITVELPLPFKFNLQPFDEEDGSDGPEMLPYMDCTMSIFRDDLIADMQECGVDNLGIYPLEIYDPDDPQKKYTNYKAVNIIGRVRYVGNLKKCEELILRVDNAVGVFVHEKLKDFLIAKGYTELVFYNLAEAAY
jgi:hypothetical protein